MIFKPKRISPSKLKPMEFYVETNNYSVAEDKAFEKLESEIDSKLLSYYASGSTLMMPINIIK